MIKSIEIKVLPDKINDLNHIEQIQNIVLKGINGEIKSRILTRKSIDARKTQPVYVLRYDIYIDETYNEPIGPAGYFAALDCIESGLKPIVIERGKDVRERRRDLRSIQQDGIINPDSNYCFGEGGAGTYSDGKLYTRSHKRGKIEKVLRLLVEHGANSEILSDAHPHIGSNKLPVIIANIRETIEKFGGEVHFNHKVTDLLVSGDLIEGVKCGEKEFRANHVVLATGHSARDIYHMLHEKGILIEPKPFALGLRIEHSQSFIDKIQYRQSIREENLPASSYNVVTQVNDKGVFSFCMCPGGLVVPAATSPGEIVVNGMSLSRRDSAFANSGLVTSIELNELNKHGYKGIFAALDFQTAVEKAMFAAGDGSQKAPAQRVADFVNGVLSPELNNSSYIPGLFSAPLHKILPGFVFKRLRQGLINIDKKMKGYITNEANIIGVESRTSSTIKIPRDETTLCHPQILCLYPTGEGAGYAGGIISAAMDGQRVVKAIKLNQEQNLYD